MDGGKDAGTHGAKAPHVADEAAIHALGIGRIGILLLLGEGVVLQPRQQLEIHSNALVAILRGMNVHIVHSRNEQAVTKVGDRLLIATK